VSTVSGLANSFPFLYQGLEHEVSDPGQLYFEPSGNVYNPQLQRELSQLGQQGLTGPPSGGGDSAGYSRFGNFGHPPPAQAGQSLGQTFQQLGTVASAASALFPTTWFGFSIGGSEGFSGAIPIPFLSALLGGGGDDQPAPARRRSENYKEVGVPLDYTPPQQSIGNPGRPLTPCEKDCLKPYIAQVDLDNARLHTNGLPWYTTPFRGLVDGTTPPGGSDIYIRAGKYDGSPEALALLGHELKHVEQWRNDPTVGIPGYFFHMNKYEAPAYDLQDRISKDFSEEHFGGCK